MISKQTFGGFKKGEMVVISSYTKQKWSNQEIAFMLAFSQAKAGRNVKLSKENGQWIVKILAA